MIHAIHHVALRCVGTEEMERTIRFYTELLGLEIIRRWGEGTGSGCMLGTGNGIIEIFADAQPGRSAGQIDHIALATSDVDGCIEKVRAAGFAVTEEPHDICIPSEPPCPARIAFCKGAAGEIIEFFCEM